MIAWNRGLPDSDITVLVRTDSPEYPVCTASHNGDDGWVADDAFPLEYRVSGWMHLHVAAELLDAART